MRREVEERIAALAARQHGVATRGQLVQAGLSPSGVDRRLAGGRYRALHAGVYLLLPMPLPNTRLMAAVLASGTGAVVCRRSAGPLWGVRAEGEGSVEVAVPGNRGHRPGIQAHRVEIPCRERTLKEGIPVTTLARTLLDLASVLPSDELEAVLARALRGGRVTAEELARILGRHPGYPGVRPLRALLQLAGGPAFTRSEAEVQLLALVREAGLPPPACNVEVEGYEVDLYWPPARLAVEVDGYRYHGSHASFERDRRKDAALVAAGITVLRLSWRQVTEGRVATAVKLGQALDRAGGRTWPRGP